MDKSTKKTNKEHATHSSLHLPNQYASSGEIVSIPKSMKSE